MVISFWNTHYMEVVRYVSNSYSFGLYAEWYSSLSSPWLTTFGGWFLANLRDSPALFGHLNLLSLSYPQWAIMRAARDTSSNVRPETYSNQTRPFWYHRGDTRFASIVLPAWFHAFVAKTKFAECQLAQLQAALVFRKHALVTITTHESNELSNRDKFAHYKK